MSTMRDIEATIATALDLPAISRWRLALGDLIAPAAPGHRDAGTLLFATLAAPDPAAAAAVIANGAQARVASIRLFQGDEHWAADPEYFDQLPATPLDALVAAITLAVPIDRLTVEIGGKRALVVSQIAGYGPVVTASVTYAIDDNVSIGAPMLRELHNFQHLANQLHDIIAHAPLQPPAASVSPEMH